LRLAADDDDSSRPIRCQWHVMSSSSNPIRSSSGLLVNPTSGLLDPEQLDYIVVVGGLLLRRPVLDRITGRYLSPAAAGGAALAGICTGSFVLCRLGLLQGRKCCISWFHYRDFLVEFSHLVPVADQLYVIDGNRITCGGGVGVTHLAAEFVARHLGFSTAQKVLRMQHIAQLKPGHSVQPAPPLELRKASDCVSRALLIMQQTISQPLPIPGIAARLKISARQLERSFRQATRSSPHAAYLRLRLMHARWMLKTHATIGTIAVETGFADGAHFGKAFRAQFESTPSH